jgi:putative ABC transport system permease protein
MNVITRGIRNAFRNVIRTLSIVTILGLSIGLSLAMLLANQAVGQKIESVKANVGNTVSISPAGVRGFEGGGEALTETALAKAEKLDHVTATNKSLSDRLDTDNTNLASAIDAGSLGKRFSQNSGQKVLIGPGPSNSSNGGAQPTTSFTPPVTVVGTTEPTKLSNNQGGGTFTLKEGKVFGSDSDKNVALLGKTLAEKNNLKVGSTFTAYGQTITVAGIFDAGNDFANNQVIMPLNTVQTLTEQPDSVTSATLTVDSISNVENVTKAAQSALGDSADVVNNAEEAKQSIEPLQNIQTISLYSLIGSVVAGIVIVLMTMIMIVRERRREIGVIKAIGASNIRVVGQFMTEAVTLTTLSAVIGIALGAIAGNPITKMLLNNTSSATQSGGPVMVSGPIGGLGRGFDNINAVVGWDIILYGIGAAMLIAIIGSAVASFFIAKVRPAEVMRAE